MIVTKDDLQDVLVDIASECRDRGMILPLVTAAASQDGGVMIGRFEQSPTEAAAQAAFDRGDEDFAMSGTVTFSSIEPDDGFKLPVTVKVLDQNDADVGVIINDPDGIDLTWLDKPSSKAKGDEIIRNCLARPQ